MRIKFLGTGGYHPNARRQTAGVLLPEIGLLLDAGTGTHRVTEHLLGDELTIALTHAHLDHICGLTYLLVPLHRGRIRKLRVLGAPCVLDAVRRHLFADPIFPVVPPCEFVPLAEGQGIDVAAGVTLSHRVLTSHPGSSRGYRVAWRDNATGQPRSLAYITDTTVDGRYTDFIRGVDLLIHECYFPDDLADWAAKTGHSYTSQVARLADEAEVGRLVLTHIDPQRTDDDPVGLATARAIFPATEMAEDLAEFVV